MEPQVKEKTHILMSHEFVKFFAKSAVTSLEKLDGKSERSKYYDIIASGAGSFVGFLPEDAKSFQNLIRTLFKVGLDQYDKTQQEVKKITVMSTVDAKSSQDFPQEFLQLFVTLGLCVFDIYRADFEYINLKAKSTSHENKVLAIQMLGEYAGAKCFSHMHKHGSKSEMELTQSLQETSKKRWWSSVWDLKTGAKTFYVWTKKKEGGEPAEQKLITPYKVYAGVLRNLENKYTLLKTNNDEKDIDFDFSYDQKDFKNLSKSMFDQLSRDPTFSKDLAAQTNICTLVGQGSENMKTMTKIKDDIRTIPAQVASELLKTQNPLPKNIRFNVEEPIQTFTGRELFLVELHKIVKECHKTVVTQAPFPVVAATGGMGKTEAVRMYIQRHPNEYDHVIWIDAEVNSSAKNQFTQLAIELDISTDFKGKQKEFELIKKQIFEKLLQHKHKVLLVLDNAEVFEDDKEHKLDGIRCLLPKSLSPSFVKPTVIVTSRNQNWSLQKVIQLDLWTEGEVFVFVKQRLGLEETAENNELATQLGNIFGRLPIALQAAVAVILQQIKRKKKYGIQNLIDEYNNGSRRVIAQKPLVGNMRPTQTTFTMSVLWNISFEKLVKYPDGELAIKILCFMAYLSPTKIPQYFLFALFQKHFSQDSFENALETLEDHSLIASSGSADSASGSFSIHRMIQDATIENLRTNEAQKPRVIFNDNTFLNETAVLLKLSADSISYIKTLDTRDLARRGEIVENLVQITSHVSKNLDVQGFRDLTAEVAGVLRSTNDFAKSIELYERVLKATPASDVESEIRDQIVLKRILALTYSEGGFNQKSMELFTEVLEDETRALGLNHKETLQTKGHIADALRCLGAFDEAASKFSEVLQDFRNNQNTESESFLTTKHNYAILLDDQGKTEEALKLYTEVAEEHEKNPNSKPEDVILTKGNRALLLGKQGKFEEASAMMLQIISDASRVFGPFHVTTLIYKRHYASLLCRHGKHAEAAQLFLELLELHETQLGSEHPETLASKNDLAVLYLDTEEPDKALPLLNVEVFERVFGPEHPYLMSTANNLAAVMNKKGKFGDALSLHNKCLKLRKQVLGPNHPDTLLSMYNVGVVHYKMEEFDKAAEVFQDLFLRGVEVFGENYPSTIKILEWLTDCRKILDERNDLIVNFTTLTSVDAEIGRSLLEASNWNMEVALEIFFNSKSTKDVAGFETQDEAFVPFEKKTHFGDQTLDVNSANGNTAKGD